MSSRISRVRLKDFTTFQSADLKFVNGINVVAGENGSGKSHLLKVLYTLIAASQPGRDASASSLEARIAAKLVGVFRPDSLGRLVRRRRGHRRAELSLEFRNPNDRLDVSFASNSRSEVVLDRRLGKSVDGTPVYLPTRELMTIYPGFVALYEQTQLEFEETWRDTCLRLGLPLSRGPRQERAKFILDPLELSLGGSVFDDASRFYLHVPGGGNYEMPLVAEGMRKLAMLHRLVANGTLFESGFLFWDEPEANLNPRVLRHVAAIITALARSGVQVFVGTHSLFLMKELEIIQRTTDGGPDLRFFSLSGDPDDGAVASGSALEDLDGLALLDESLAQSDRFLDALDA